jgi:nitrate/nitrite transporter NarK
MWSRKKRGSPKKRTSVIIREVFSGNAGELSSKRAMMFLSFLVMLFLAYASIFMEKEIQQFIFDGFLYIVVGSLFSVASEKFSRKFPSNHGSHSSEVYDNNNDVNTG